MQDEAITLVSELDRQLVAAFIGRDADLLLSQYWNSPELFTVGEGGQATQGWQAAREFQLRFFSITEDIDMEVQEWHRWAFGDGVLSTCPFTLTARFKGGGSRRLAGWYTNLRKRMNGRWLIVFEHISSNLPSPSGA